MPKSMFETKTCSRCGGSGKYSWNAMTGYTCFGCRGSGEQLTKRGQAAQQYFKDLRSAKLHELVPGDMVTLDIGLMEARWQDCKFVRCDAAQEDRGCGRFLPDGSVEWLASYVFLTPSGKEYSISNDGSYVVLRKPTIAMRDEALAFQSKVTKTVAISKRSV